MRTVQLTRLARQDLIDIWRFTAKHWGEMQADSYLDAIERAVSGLTTQPEIGARRHYLANHYRVVFANQHAVYYSIGTKSIRIIRVLNARMDPERHL